MKIPTYQFSFLVAVIVSLSCSSVKKNNAVSLNSELDQTAPVNRFTANEAKNNWKLLFNGKNFAGWHGYNLKAVPDCWIIEDNSLTMTTEGRVESYDLLTDRTYKNFALSAEFKLTKGANSGIIFQVNENLKYKFPYNTGPEFQIIHHKNWPDPFEDWQICGANYALSCGMEFTGNA